MAVHSRLEEMRFRHGVLLMVTAGTLLVTAVTLIAMALTGGEDKTPSEPPVADSSSAAHPPATGPARHSPSPRSTRRPRTSSSTVVGVPPSVPAATPHPESRATTPGGVPPWWQHGYPHEHRWHGSPPPWWSPH